MKRLVSCCGQKLVIFEARKCTQTDFLWVSAPNPAKELTSLYQAARYLLGSVSDLCDWPSGNLSVHLSVDGLCVRKVYCGKTVEWTGCHWDGEWSRSRCCIRLGLWSSNGKGQFLGVNLGRPIVTNGDFATWLFPNYFGHDCSSYGMLSAHQSVFENRSTFFTLFRI